jgi:hypothetical protein
VLAAINSTPERPFSIILLIAFPPLPPTPITLIIAPEELIELVSKEIINTP